MLPEAEQFPFAGVERRPVLGELLFGRLQFALAFGKLAGGSGKLRMAVFKLQLAGVELLLELAEFPLAGVKRKSVLGELLFGGLQFALAFGEVCDGGRVECVAVIELQLPGGEFMAEAGKFLFAGLQSRLEFVQFVATQFSGLPGSGKFTVEFGKFFLKDVGSQSVFSRLFIELQLSFPLLPASLLKFIKNSGNCGFGFLQFLFTPTQTGFDIWFCCV